jgi:hypothetical protein
MSKSLSHFKTITYHKYLVAKGCFRVGLYRQGILHDLSKYSPTEFRVGAKYFQGTRSPNNAEREEIGCSTAWLHHKGRNKHHFEYWFDYSLEHPGRLMPVPMPDRYIAEMLMDRIAACKVYGGKQYTDQSPWLYYKKGPDKADVLIHPKTKEKLERLLLMLAEEGEDKTFAYVKREFVKRKSEKGKKSVSQ